nr:NADH-ubiquinone oxidoreductase, chain 49kDa,subunit I, D subunit [uncultured bacterium]
MVENTTEAKQLREETMMMNMGPSHPAMHGIIRIVLELDGERVVNSDVEIGYLHRCFEKSAEQSGYLQVIPYTDRLNYVSPLINNVGYCLAVEKLFGIQVTERCAYIRVIMSELSRVCDHLTCIGANAMELGAFTAFLYMMKAREFLWQAIEMVTGARLTISYVRPGGVKGDLPQGFEEITRKAIKETREVLKESHALLTKNRIFVDRLKNVGILTKEMALAYGITGPFLRGSGIDFDVRKNTPYLIYDKLDFDIPVGTIGDNYDRYLCRMEEMEQSLRIVEQCLAKMPKGNIQVDMQGREINAAQMVDDAKLGKTEGLIHMDVRPCPTLEGANGVQYDVVQTKERRAILPSKEDTYGSIEGLMNHFKLVMDNFGIRPPKGEVYQAVEGGNGELGFYVISDGTGTPYRVRVRPPCFPIMAALSPLINGGLVSDIVATFGSVNMIGGELDR